MKHSVAVVAGVVVSVAGGCQTTLLIESDPPYADLVLAKSGVYGVTDEVTPIPNSVFRDGTVQEDSLHLSKEGYRDVEVPIALRKGRRNDLAPTVLRLDPIVTSLEVLTSPEDASVEDVTAGGFGYLGETPMTRSFTWDDVSRWADVVTVRRGGHTFKAMKLDLRIEKPGYETVMMEDVLVPVGEERSFKRVMDREGEITFTSEPYGVTVYVMRRDNGVEYLKRLGTTPFPYSDADEALQHGETLYWEKTGYISEQTPYVEGNAAFHAVLASRREVVAGK